MLYGHWSSYLAAKAIVVSIGAFGVGLALSRLALPGMVDALAGAGSPPPRWAAIALDYHHELPLLGAPGLLLGIAALMFRTFRAPLAVAAMLAAGVATAGILAMLVGTLAPFYDASGGF